MAVLSHKLYNVTRWCFPLLTVYNYIAAPIKNYIIIFVMLRMLIKEWLSVNADPPPQKKIISQLQIELEIALFKEWKILIYISFLSIMSTIWMIRNWHAVWM